MGGSQFTMTLLCLWMGYGHAPILDFRGLPISHPQGHGELGPPQTCRMEAGAGSNHDGTRNMSRAVHLLYLFRYQIKGRFCQYISLPMKYTVSVSTLQYNVGLTLSFLSLISLSFGDNNMDSLSSVDVCFRRVHTYRDESFVCPTNKP